MNKVNIKLVLLGEGRVGKTSLILRYISNQFDQNTQSTLNASYTEKSIMIGKEMLQLSIWDTPGQEKFSALAPIYYRDADVTINRIFFYLETGAVLVYDITTKETFSKVARWLTELRENCGENIVLVIVGNKCDEEKNRQIKKEDAEEYAKKNNAKYFETSAKINQGIKEVFAYLASEILKKNKLKEKEMRKTILLVDDKQRPKKHKEDCCQC